MSEEDGQSLMELSLRHSRVLICGSRTWGTGSLKVDPYDYSKGPQYDPGSNEAQLTLSIIRGLMDRHEKRARRGEKFYLIEGAAPGADSIAWDFAMKELPQDQHLHFPADWRRLGRQAGYVRNRQMLEEGRPNLVVCFSRDIENSNGTKMMRNIAKAAQVETYVVGL